MTMHIPPDESICYIIRRHWYVYFESALPSMLLFFIIVPALIAIGTYVGKYNTRLELLVFFFLAGYVLIEWSLLFLKWINYYLDVWLITEKRILDIEQHTMFVRDVSELRLDRVQDITVEVRGMLPTFFNFGNVLVQTAGSVGVFKIQKVARPYEIRNIIAREVDKAVLQGRNIINGI